MRALATALVLEIPVVTDDWDMSQLANAFGIAHWGTLELLRLMVDVGRLTEEQVRAVASYLAASGDLPGGYSASWRRLFTGQPP